MSDDEPKTRRNVTIPESIDKKLKQDHVNASGLVTQLLRAYFAHGSVAEGAEYVVEARDVAREERLSDALEVLASRQDVDSLTEYNDAVLTKAAQLEVPADVLVSAVQQYASSGEVPDI